GSGIKLNDLLTVSLGNVGVIEHVVNETGAATPTNTTPSTVTSFP
ncbi:MAG: coagulation factor 5/8 type domain protein, partial [Actinomycetia bacterium]|nr:coagulation factor 5/8 type domain protein [Actinomycetes bacterium]